MRPLKHLPLSPEHGFRELADLDGDLVGRPDPFCSGGGDLVCARLVSEQPHARVRELRWPVWPG
jgi:hypothetical protein